MSDEPDEIYDATKSPLPDSDLVPHNPNPEHFRSARVALAVQGILLLALGVGGMLAALLAEHTGPSGAAVLVFHFTPGHAAIIIGTGVLSLVVTYRHRWAFWYAWLQAVLYLALFIGTTGDVNWITDNVDSALHGLLGMAGLAFVLWIPAKGMIEWTWTRRRDHDR